MNIYKCVFTCLIVFVTTVSYSQNVKVIKYNDLESILASKGDTLLVVNFWATWCLPCVKELPYFEKLQSRHTKEKIKVLLVSLDYSSLLDKKVIPFIAKTGIKFADVFLLNETDANSWIGKVAPQWSGALPFTLIIDGRKNRKGYERPFTLEELETEVQSFIQ